MCGRFNIIDDPLTQFLMEITGVMEGWSLTTQFNIAPTETVPVLLAPEDKISGQPLWQLTPMRWWLVPGWSPGPSTRFSMFNAKSETLASSRAYKGAFARRRCVIPVSGYYEWVKENDLKIPLYIEPEEDAGFALAGLWERWEKGGEVILSCTIVTAAAPPPMQSIHHRIPVHLTKSQARQWTSSETDEKTLSELLQPEIRTPIRVTPVSTYVNNARNKDARCMETVGEVKIIH